MKVLVRAKKCRVPARVRALAEEKVVRVTRLARDAGSAEVEFSETGHHHCPPSTVCEVTVHLRRDVVRAHAAGVDASSALDLTIDKVEHQLARIKEKRVARTHGDRGHNGSPRA
jgi:ribosomal subunit interface protein